MKIKVLFFDFDGTIISNKTGILPDSARDTLTKLKEAGYVLILNTGRTKAILSPITNTIAFDGRILGCGSYVEYQNEVIYIAEVEKKLHKDIISKIKEYDIEAFLEGKEYLYISDNITSERLLYHLREYEKNNIKIKPISDNMEFQKSLFTIIIQIILINLKHSLILILNILIVEAIVLNWLSRDTLKQRG